MSAPLAIIDAAEEQAAVAGNMPLAADVRQARAAVAELVEVAGNVRDFLDAALKDGPHAETAAHYDRLLTAALAKFTP